MLLNGALPGNVYWFVGSSATIGDYAVMVGNIIAYASITLNSYSTLTGRGLAGAAITCASACIINLAVQTCAAPLGLTAQKPLGVNFLSCSDLVLDAQTTITFGGEHTYVTGDIGISPGYSITGEYIPGHYGSTYVDTGYAVTCAADMATILAQGAGQPCISIAAELGKYRRLFYYYNNNLSFHSMMNSEAILNDTKNRIR